MTPTPPVMAALQSVGISPKVFNDVSQSGHFLAGCLAIFAPVVLLGPWWRFVGAGVITAFAIVHLEQVRERVVVLVEQMIVDHRAGYKLPAPQHQQLDQRVFARRQRHRLAAANRIVECAARTAGRSAS